MPFSDFGKTSWSAPWSSRASVDSLTSPRGSVQNGRKSDGSREAFTVGVPGLFSRPVPTRLAHYKMTFPGVFPRESTGKVEVEGAPDMEAFVRSVLDRFPGWEKSLAGMKKPSERLDFLREYPMRNHIIWGMWIGQHPEDIDFVRTKMPDEERPDYEPVPPGSKPSGLGSWAKETKNTEDYVFRQRYGDPLDECVGPRNEEPLHSEVPTWISDMERNREDGADETRRTRSKEDREGDEGDEDRRDSGVSLVGRVFGRVKRVMSGETDGARKKQKAERWRRWSEAPRRKFAQKWRRARVASV